MKMFKNLFDAFKLVFIVSLTTGIILVLFSFLGHLISPGRLIPLSMIGGAAGILTSIYFLYKLNLIDAKYIVEIFVSTVIAFGFVSLVAIFNFDKPFIILPGFLLVGLTTLFSNRYFQKNKKINSNERFGILGIILVFPVFYFCFSSILKSGFKVDAPFSIIDFILKSPDEQKNFNEISPFIFGGGLMLAFIINLYVISRRAIVKSGAGKLKIIWKNIHPLNFGVIVASCLLSATIFIYLFVENYKS